MKRLLKRNKIETYYYKNSVKILGIHSGISGDVTDISGNVSGIIGDVSGIRGDVSGISGDVTDIRGDVDLCDITTDERTAGLTIEDLITDEK